MSDPTGLTKDGVLDPVVKLLAALIIFLVLLMVGEGWWFPNDGQTFQVISGLLTGFAGALLMRVKPEAPKSDSPKQSDAR